jgi:hypothetical protein
MIPNRVSTHDTPTHSFATTCNRVVKTQTEASIVELLLGGTPPDDFKISNHETIQPSHERSEVQDSFAQMLADAEAKMTSPLLRPPTAEELQAAEEDKELEQMLRSCCRRY